MNGVVYILEEILDGSCIRANPLLGLLSVGDFADVWHYDTAAALPEQSQPAQLTLCCTTMCAMILPARPGLSTTEKAHVGALKWKVGYDFRLAGEGLFPSFPVSFKLISMSLPFSCALYLAIRAATKTPFLYFWFCGECVNFSLYQQHDFTHPRVDVGGDS